MDKTNKLGAAKWFNLILFGLMGQIAWNVENMYFNTFLYNSVYNGATQNAVNNSIDVMSAISKMVAYSAITAVVTTFLMGILSDRVNRRKWFISVGYILWGAVTSSFGLITRDNVASLFNMTDEVKILTATVMTVIVMDCVMTFMGSTSNDSAFNAWVTDVTNEKNRATCESVLAMLPIFAMAIVMGLGGVVEGIGYPAFFTALGVTVAVCGVIGLFTLKDNREGKKSDVSQSFFREFIYGFRPSVIKENSRLYISLVSIGIFGVAVQVFFPYLFIYLQHSMGFTFDKLLASLTPTVIVIALIAVIAVVALVISIGKLIDRFGKDKFIFLSIVLFVAGLVITGFMKKLGGFAIGIALTFAGYGLLMILLNASVRDFTPEDKTGMFQGIRMIFAVLLPMVIGPVIGREVCKFSAITYTNEYGVVTSAPGNTMFFAAAITGVFIIIPVLMLKKKGLKK